MRRLILGCAVALATACGGGETMTGTDSGMTTPTDSGSMPTLPPPMLADGAPPDLSCLGTATAPTPGAAASIAAHTYFFPTTSDDVGGATVQIFPGNRVLETCAAPDCIEVMSGSDGAFTFMAPQPGWFAYRVLASTSTGGNQPVLTLGYNREAETGTVEVPVVGTTILGLLPGLFRRTRVTGTASMSGSVEDCAGNTIQNIQARIYRDGTLLVPTPRTEAMGYFVGYLMGSTPATTDYSTPDGTFVGANIMPGAGRVEIYGRMSESDTELTRIACEEAGMVADGVTILTLRPTRTDYAAGSGCL